MKKFCLRGRKSKTPQFSHHITSFSRGFLRGVAPQKTHSNFSADGQLRKSFRESIFFAGFPFFFIQSLLFLKVLLRAAHRFFDSLWRFFEYQRTEKRFFARQRPEFGSWTDYFSAKEFFPPKQPDWPLEQLRRF